MNYSKYYDLESYLFGKVAENFKNRHYLTAEEFFCIIIWKANRAKSKIAKKFESETNLDKAIKKLTSTIHKSVADKNKLAILMNDYGFYLPMFRNPFSAISRRIFSL